MKEENWRRNVDARCQGW